MPTGSKAHDRKLGRVRKWLHFDALRSAERGWRFDVSLVVVSDTVRIFTELPKTETKRLNFANMRFSNIQGKKLELQIFLTSDKMAFCRAYGPLSRCRAAPERGLSPELRLTNRRSAYHCSLHNVIADVIADFSVFLCLFVNKRKREVIFVHQNLISNRVTYLVHAKSTAELISFGFSGRSVRSSVSDKRSANRSVQKKKTTSIFG